jgi:protease IV
MRQFFKFMFASMLGVFLSLILAFFVLIGIITAIISSADEKIDVEANTVLHMNFERIVDRASGNPLEGFSFSGFGGPKAIGLNDILNNLKKAETDDNIKGIFLDLSSVNAGAATIEEVRKKLLEFKTNSGKFIYAYGEYYPQDVYYLASVADSIFLNPQGALELKGMGAQVVFFKNTLDKLEIDAQIIRHGKFKSAVEPFMLDKMSESNRLQTSGFVNSIWNHLTEGISKARNISVEELNNIANDLKIRRAEDAVEHKLADRLAYKDEVLELLRNETGADDIKKIKMLEMARYTKAPAKKAVVSADKIAVIYAVGSIEGGEGDNETIGSEGLSKAVRDARMDDKVKAIVLRVNSPGGSALASEVIWRELKLAKEKKPIIVSMGDLAASGGYYIACMADTIVASPSTITGSIGVFGVVWNMEQFLKNKIGVTVDTVKSNNYADLGAFYRPLSANERDIIQQSVEDVYDVFITRVAEGRGMTKEQVDELGQGRVWSGVDAKRIGLVDVFGGLETAIDIAAKKANLENYRIVNFPEQKDPFKKFLGSMSGEVSSFILKNELGASYNYYKQMKSITMQNGIQARSEYELILK